MQNVLETQITVKGQKIGRYILEKRIGQGQFGTVWRARTEDTNEIFAVKKIRKDSIDNSKVAFNLLRTEISIMNEINHPNILHLFEFIYSKKNYYLITTYCEQKDFESYMATKGIKSFEEPEAVYFLKQIMNGFMVLREHKILHRDFKLANLLMHDDRLIIGDFGFAKQGFEIAQTKLGTPITQAPELLFARPDENIEYNSKADLWSIGVVFYQILFGVLPFNGDSILHLQQNIRKVLKEGIPFPKPVSDEAKNLICGLLTLDPIKRIEWTAFFTHPIFSSKQNSDIKNITQTFGQMGQMNVTSINTEFQNNKLKKNLGDKINFPKDLEEINKLNKNLQGKPIEEEKLNNVQQAKIVAESMAKEVNFRLSHELNKVYFFIYCVHKIQRGQKYSELSKVAGVGLNLSILILIRAKLVNTKIRNIVEKKANVFKLADFALKNFYESEYKLTLLNYLVMNEKGLSDHLVLLLKRCKENKIELTCQNLIKKDVDENSVNAAIGPEITRFVSTLPLEGFPDKTLNRMIVLYKAMAKLIRDPDSNFSYLGNLNKDAKFNWNRLYYILERLPVEELRNNI